MDNNSSFSFKTNPFDPKDLKQNTNKDKKTNSKTDDLSKPNPDIDTNFVGEYFNNEGDSPKFNIIKDDLLNEIDHIPQSELDFKSTIQQEVHRKESKGKLGFGINKVLSNNQVYDSKDEVEHAKKSHLEYLRFIRDNKDPIGITSSGGPRAITSEELAKHHHSTDLWMAVNGEVFDLTIYLDYHPGGEKMLMKGAGKDATDLFNYHHPWVNYHNLVGKLQVGYLKK
jgi:cytochrome b involved in lipid metabolism